MLNLYGSHDRRDFKVNCYSYGQADGYTYRRKIEQDCDNFIDLFHLSHVESARRIYQDGVDILVDLVGHTEDNRMTICGYRPVPIQVSYLGFLGSSGADFMDYIITDRVVTPEAHAPYYSENFVYMPHSYQINDYLTETSQTGVKRQEFGLPDDTFVFCSFNKPYKIEPVMFDSWMNILRKVDNCVLWLISGGKTADWNLKLAARERGVDSGRLIFAEMVPLEQHLERLQLADLALDTRIYNGGATTSNALGTGVPLITLLGDHFVSRMSASSLQAIGLPELITHSLEEYEALAVRLARNPAELRSIRQKLNENRSSTPLFDHLRYVRNLENAYRQMWEIFLTGEKPRQIDVMDTPGL
jgi:protein O-GlcNAc transferase